MNIYKVTLIRAVSVCILLLMISSEILAQRATTGEQAKAEQANKAADQLISRFRETLDVGVVFNEMASSYTSSLLQQGRFSLDQVERHFVQSLDTKNQDRLFRAEMNFYYINFAYNLTFIENLGCEERENIPLPSQIRDFVEKSKYVKDLFDFSNTHNMPQISTKDALIQYLQELETVTLMLRRHLPPDFYETKIYKENYKKYVQNQDIYHRPHTDIIRGALNLGVPANTEVVLVIRDLFTMYFVEENGQMKLLAFGVGN